METEKNLSKEQTSNDVKTDVMQYFLLPFRGIIDLERAYKKILEFHKMEEEQTIANLKDNKIPYQILETCGVIIDIETVPKGINLEELISNNEELKKKVYESVGVIKNII